MSATIIDEAKAAFEAAGLDATQVAESVPFPEASGAYLRVNVGDGHITLSLMLWPFYDPRLVGAWSGGIAAYHPVHGRRAVRGFTTEMMLTPKAALASTLTQALGQAWPTEAESAAMLGMLTRLRESEASK